MVGTQPDNFESKAKSLNTKDQKNQKKKRKVEPTDFRNNRQTANNLLLFFRNFFWYSF